MSSVQIVAAMIAKIGIDLLRSSTQELIDSALEPEKVALIRQHIVGEINEANWQQRVKPCQTVLNEANKNNDSPDLIQVEEMCK